MAIQRIDVFPGIEKKRLIEISCKTFAMLKKQINKPVIIITFIEHICLL